MTTPQQFLKKVKDYIDRNKLFDASATHIVALSGGADSTALLIAMKALGYNVEAAHCNFKLRGKESDRDELFCRKLCERLNIKLHVVHFDTREYASMHHVSIEMAARTLRYTYFEQLRRDIDASTIVVAHHVEDCAETVLINLVRGTGLDGLCGIRPRNGHLRRPFLGITRKEIEDFLKSQKQDWVTDSTNLVDDAVRNKIRLNIMPLLTEINAKAASNISAMAARMQQAEAIVNDSISKFTDKSQDIVCYLPAEENDKKLDTGAIISIDALKKYVSPEYALYSLLKPFNFNGRQCGEITTSIRNGNASGHIWTSDTHEMTVHSRRIIIERIHNITDKDMILPEEGTYRYDASASIIFKTASAGKLEIIRNNHDVAQIDAGKAVLPLHVRHVRAADRFVPFGMKGSKLVSDFMTDCKMNVFEKKRQLVVTDDNGSIIWVAGKRISNNCAISGNTKKAIILELKG